MPPVSPPSSTVAFRAALPSLRVSLGSAPGAGCSIREHLGSEAMDRSSPQPVRPRYQWLLFLVLLLGLLTARRSQQLFSPQVWVEDGTQILERFIAEGWSSFFAPVNGLLLIIPKIISITSLKISFTNYPLTSTIFAWLFILLVGLAIAYSPTKIQGKLLCSVLVFMTPADPEVFGLPSYTFWWASLLLLLLPLWDEKVPLLALRLGIVVLCGLSSPVIVAVLPALYLRSYRHRSLRPEHLVASFATLIAGLQLCSIAHGSGAGVPPIVSSLKLIVPKFFGAFLIGNWTHNEIALWPAGMAVLTLVASWLLHERRQFSSWVLFYLLVASIVMTAARVDPAVLHPRRAGPRYFFLPFIFTFWILVQYLYISSRSALPRIATEVVIALAVINAEPVWSRDHDDLRWKSHVHSSGLFRDYAIPVHYDGRQQSKRFLRISGKDAAALLKSDLLFSWNERDRVPTFPYKVISTDESGSDEDGAGVLVSTTMSGPGHRVARVRGHRVIGSFGSSDAGTCEVTLKLRRGGHILYRSGGSAEGQSIVIKGQEHDFLPDLPATTEWVRLSFTNARLPGEFVVTVKDEGKELEEWSSVGIKDW